ncbi:ABC transporter ATP-binding protein [Dethiobacter alkaliphilus]|nr:ABC transporter ATP-binding protein [Dethiobacter alkaliphilus]
MSVLLKIQNLRTIINSPAGVVRAVDGVDLQIGRGEIVAVVGESGCGKSTMALSIMGLISSPDADVWADCLQLDGTELQTLSAEEKRRLRGRRISMVFQEPMSSLNPVLTVGEQVEEALLTHQRADKKTAGKKTIELLERVRIPSAAERLGDYPHQLSGGMQQRVMLAMALACEPDLLIADEPTTALDVTVQAQILQLLCELQNELGMAVLLITHDLGIVAEVANRVMVMYAGKLVEEAKVDSLFSRPLHPYTKGLLESRPELTGGQKRLHTISGAVADMWDLPTGCRFHPRCPQCMEHCQSQEPQVFVRGDATVRCWLYAQGVAP